jgi:hypothetical protein
MFDNITIPAALPIVACVLLAGLAWIVGGIIEGRD